MNIDATQNTKAPVATEILKDAKHGLPPSGEQVQAVLEGPIANLEQHKQSTAVDTETKKASEHVQQVLQTTKQMLVDNSIQDLMRQLVEETTQFSRDAEPIFQEISEKVKNSNNPELKRELYYLRQSGSQMGRGIRTLLRNMITDNEFRRAGFDLIDHMSALFQVTVGGSADSTEQAEIDFLDQTVLEPEAHPPHPTNVDQPLTATPPTQQHPTGGQETGPKLKMREVSEKDVDAIGHDIDVILEKSGHDQALGEALGSLIAIYQHIQHHAYEKTHHTDSGPKDPTFEKFEQLRSNPHYKAAQTHLREILEHFAGGKSLQGLILAVKDFIRLTANDEKIRHLQTRLEETFDEIHQSSNQQGSEFRRKLTDIIREARQELSGDDRYRYATQRLLTEAQQFFKAIQRDPVNRQMAEAWRNIADDLFEDEQHTKLSKKGLQGFENVFRHLLVTEFQYVPIPRIEFSNEDISAILDDMVFRSAEVLPDKLVFRASTTNQLAVNEENRSENLLEVYLEQVRFSMEDFYFWFHRKSFPAITDEGRADIAVRDQGVKVHLALRVTFSQKRDEKGKGPLHLEVKRADVSIDNLKLKVRHAKNHQFLLKMATPFVKGTIRTRMQQGLESAIRKLVDRVNMYMDSRNHDYMSGLMNQYLA